MDTVNLQDYWETRLKKSFGLEAVGYLGLGKQYNRWLYRVRRRVFLRQMKSLGVDFSGAEVLDVGSGTGFYIDRWKELGVKKAIGTDITNVSVAALQRKYPGDEFYQLDIGNDLGSMRERRFDMVSAFDVLFHIVDDARFARAIQNINFILKPGGVFVLSDNFLHGETIRAAQQVSRSLKDIEKVLTSAGFKIVERAPMFILMNYPVDSRSRLLKKVWRILAKVISIHESCGFLIGALLYPLEQFCVASAKESPTTEMMICRKPS
jgi:SAM-dependent methyltransferase